MTIYISKLKWAWQAQFLSHILVILKNNVFFEDKQMILQSLCDIFTGFRFPKKYQEPSYPVVKSSLSYHPIFTKRLYVQMRKWEIGVRKYLNAMKLGSFSI